MAVQGFDINKFLGVWYGLAHNILEAKKACLKTTEEFTVQQSGYQVLKTCIREDGTMTAASGTITFLNNVNRNYMKITYPKQGVLGTSTSVNYYVLYIDPSYSYAVVSNGDGKTFRIISKAAQASVGTLDLLEQEAAKLGFNTLAIVREKGVLIPYKGTLGK